MKAIAFFICEQALVHPDSSVDIFRYYRSTFYPESVPWYFTFSVFYHLQFESKKKGDHVVKVKLYDVDGNDRILFHHSLIVDQDPFEWVDCRSVQNMNFPKFGIYKLSLEVDEKKIAEYQLKVLDHPRKGRTSVGFQSGIDTKPSA